MFVDIFRAKKEQLIQCFDNINDIIYVSPS